MVADGKNYPKAALRFLPHASWSGLFSRAQVPVASAFLQGGASLIRGRYALLEAMRRAGAGPKTVVLLPSFHCRTMVEPALYLGAQPCFYPVTADLRPDFSTLATLLGKLDAPVVAMVLTHYFGFPNDLDQAEKFCATRGIALIEDCAHALYGRAGQRVLGSVGSYAAASVWKFLPVADGAIFLDNTGAKLPSNQQQPFTNEVKALAAMLQISAQQNRRPPASKQFDKAALDQQAHIISAYPNMRSEQSGALQEFDSPLTTLAAPRSTRWILAHTAHNRVAARRRANYNKWQEAMRTVAGVEPLFSDLPDNVVPYAFPLLIPASGIGFHLLKLAGIPIFRWEDMAITDCAIARDYRVRLLQLPCHQALGEDELNWMIHSAQKLLKGSK